MTIPHLVQYQGSKRNIAHNIIQFFPNKFGRLIEPFAGSAAISIACAFHGYANNFLINDLNSALSKLLQLVVNQPEKVANKYERLWQDQLTNPTKYYNRARDKFNINHDPVIFLYLLARCVKGSIRYNNHGEFNQSPDNRRLGTNPKKMRKNIFAIAALMQPKSCDFTHNDYREVINLAKKDDLLYIDPPYQGVCGNKDSRYYAGIDFEDFVTTLENLNRRNIDYIISYDGECGNKKYGRELPKYLNLKHLRITVGRSSQATLLGRNQQTIESLYISKNLIEKLNEK